MSDDAHRLLREIEQAAVRGWPALESAAIDGWQWRFTSGGSIRANSVATLDFSGDLDDAIARVEALYSARGAPAVFTISDVSAPAGLDERLAARGYRRGDDHVTMAKPVDPASRQPAATTLQREPDATWLSIYLSGLSADRRAVAPRLIAQLGSRPWFVTAAVDGEPASSGLTIVDGAVASVQCMATVPSARRRGGAAHVLAAIEARAAEERARHLYLQTGADNASARALYRAHGFHVVGRYHTRTREN
jgi:GNAT superfamily N-acetyltransferase